MIKTFEQFVNDTFKSTVSESMNEYDIFDALQEIEDTYENKSAAKFITTSVKGDIVTSNILMTHYASVIDIKDKTKYVWKTVGKKHIRVPENGEKNKEYIERDDFSIEVIYDKGSKSFMSVEVALYYDDFVDFLKERGVEFELETYEKCPVIVFCSEYDGINTNFSFDDLFNLVDLVYDYHMESGKLTIEKK